MQGDSSKHDDEPPQDEGERRSQCVDSEHGQEAAQIEMFAELTEAGEVYCRVVRCEDDSSIRQYKDAGIMYVLPTSKLTLHSASVKVKPSLFYKDGTTMRLIHA